MNTNQDTIDFNTLKTAWNQVKVKNVKDLQRLVPGLSDPTAIFLRRVDEDDQKLVIEFSGVANCVDKPETDVPIFNRAIIGWLRKFSRDVQIVRGGNPNALIVSMSKDFNRAVQQTMKPQATAQTTPKYQQTRQRTPNDLTNVVQRKAA